MKLHRRGDTLIEEIRLLCENKGSSHRHHEVFISTLDYYGALALPHALLDGVRYFAAPYAIGIVDQMINPVFLSHYTQLFHPIRHPRGETTGSRCDSQYILWAYLLNSLLKPFQIGSEEIPLLLQLDAGRDKVGRDDGLKASFLIDPRPKHIFPGRPHFSQGKQPK
jgi:hypothetical protein